MDHPLPNFDQIQKNIKDYVTNPRKMSGVACAFGDMTALLMGDPAGITAGICSMSSAVVMMTCGDKPWGYSAATALMAVSEFSLGFSPTVASNKALQASFIAMGALWSAGVLHAPLGDISRNLATMRPALAEHLQHISDAIPPIVSGTSLVLRVPSVISAITGHNWAALGVTAAWGTADFLAGELHKTFEDSVKSTRNAITLHKLRRLGIDENNDVLALSPMLLPKRQQQNKHHLVYSM